MNTFLTRNGFLIPALAALVLFGGLFVMASTAHAQFLSGRGMRIFLSLSPEHPRPGESVHITADSPLIDLSRSDIQWSVDDKIIAENPGQTEVDISVGPLGSETHVSVAARATDGTLATEEIFIMPTEVDLLWESDSYIPPFYRGRALPSAGTSIRASAILRFGPAGTAQPSERDIIYTWKRNGSLVPVVSGRGKYSAIFPSPSLFDNDTIQVSAATEDGKYEGEASTVIRSVEPMLTIYKDHPLFGIMYHQALEDSAFVPETEMAFTAIPYFAEAESPNDPALNYAWSVNGADIPTDESRRNTLTIKTDKSNGLAQVALSITHAVNLFMRSSGAWEISFGPAAQ